MTDTSGTDKSTALQMAIKSFNDSVGLDGIVLTLLLFGAIIRLGLPTDLPTSSTLKQAVAVWKTTELMSRSFAKRQVHDAMRSRNGPVLSELLKAAIGSLALTYRPVKDKWEGLLLHFGVRGKDIIVLLPPPSGQTKFRPTEVRLYITNGTLDPASPKSASPAIAANFTVLKRIEDEDDNSSHLWKSKDLQSADNKFYKASRAKEFKNLLESCVFELIYFRR